MFNLLAQSYSYSTNSGGGSSASFAVSGGIASLLYVIILVIAIVGMWKLFTKAGEPGWASIIPFYNTYVMLKIAGKPGWWLVLLLIPVVNFIVALIVAVEIAKRFGYSSAFGAIVCGLLGIGYLIIAFGSSTYQGPVDQVPQYPNVPPTPPAPLGPTTPPQY